MEVLLPVVIKPQPDYTTCGPTSLHAVYSYFGDTVTLPEVINEITRLEGGGTINVHLGVHALRRGYVADMWVCNTRHWDPTWFSTKTDIAAKLKARSLAKGLYSDPRYSAMVDAVEEYLARGGRVHWRDLAPGDIGRVLSRGVPILAGTNGTYLYQCIRETADGSPDDVGGDSFGHFVVVCGYHPKEHEVSIADPLKENPLFGTHYYRVTLNRLIGAIFLGTSSDDANLLMIHPRKWRGPEKPKK